MIRHSQKCRKSFATHFFMLYRRVFCSSCFWALIFASEIPIHFTRLSLFRLLRTSAEHVIKLCYLRVITIFRVHSTRIHLINQKNPLLTVELLKSFLYYSLKKTKMRSFIVFICVNCLVRIEMIFFSDFFELGILFSTFFSRFSLLIVRILEIQRQTHCS